MGDAGTMRAVAVIDVGRLEFVELPMPRVRDYECLVRIAACGLCNGTDLKHIDGTLGNIRERYPVILGHEAVGEVVEVGSKVRSFRVGDLITDPAPAIEDERYHPGCAGFCEYGVVQDVEAMRDLGLGEDAFRPLTWRAALVREPMAAEDAVMLCTFKETLSAVRNAGVGPGKDVLIYGDGPNGLSLAAFARLEGAAWVGVVGHWDERLARIERVAGADLVVNSHEQAVADALGGRRVDVAIDAVGRVAIVKEAARLLKPLGRLTVFGVLRNTEPDLSIRAIPNGTSLQMLSWPVGAQDVPGEAVGLVASGAIRASDFYSSVESWEDIEEAVRRVREREAFKIILTL